MRTTQKQNILRHLLIRPLCGVHTDWTMGRRIAARVHELRLTGFVIDSEQKCNLGHGHRTRQIVYELIGGRGKPYSLSDWCANCGRSGVLRFQTMDPDGWRMVWQCGRCGKRDYR